MSTVFKIFVRDLKRILKNPVALIVTLGVCIIPSLYAWFNILANWDPYKNTSGISVAIVNEDEGATAGDMGYLNAGDMVVDELKKNTQLGWTFTDEADGMDGVNSGKYYATIVLPSDFTSSLADVLDGDTNKAHLEYYVNEKVNAVSPKVTDTGATTIEEQINNTFAGTVSKVVADKIAGASGDALNSADQAESDLQGKISDARSTLDDLSNQLDQTNQTLQQARATASSAHDTIQSVLAASDEASGTLRDALDSLSGTRTQAESLSQKLQSSVGTGLGQVGGISSQANYDIGSLAGDVSGATTTFNDAITRLETELSQARTLETEITRTQEFVASLNDDQLSAEAKASITTSLDTTLTDLRTLTDDQQRRLDALKGSADQINQGAQDVEGLSNSLNSSLKDASDALAGLQTDLGTTTIPQINQALDTFSDAGNGLYATMGSLDPLLLQTEGLIDQLDGTLAEAQTTVSTTADQVRNASSTLQGLSDDLNTLHSTTLWDELKKASELDPQSIGDYMNGPVKLDEKPVFAVENYGSGVTPFYTNLALWVGGFVLVAIYKLEVDKEDIGDYRPWQGYLGRWMLLNLLGFLQAIICCVGDLALGIQCLSPAAFVFAGVVESFAYVGFIYALSIAFKHIGKALGVLLVVLQIPGSSGTYPIEMMPDFFQALNPWLPFTYGINAMREAIAGFYGDYYAYNLAMLIPLLIIPSILIGLGARRHLLNINTLFDRKLTETDLMIGERVPAGENQFKLSTIVKAIINSREYSQVLLARAAKFELMYPLLVKRGFWSLIIVPLVLLVLMFIVPAKYTFLVLWIISMVVICTFLIVVEYMHARVDQKTELANYSQDQLLSMLDDKLKDELFAFAPIEKLHLTHESLVDRLRALRNNDSDEKNSPNSDTSKGASSDGGSSNAADAENGEGSLGNNRASGNDDVPGDNCAVSDNDVPGDNCAASDTGTTGEKPDQNDPQKTQPLDRTQPLGKTRRYKLRRGGDRHE